ncbi:hypothetical protein KDK82_2086 [Delftia sp. K82]|nr:hypothetical protein KDK82_2086 [Delftia sp. K82]
MHIGGYRDSTIHNLIFKQDRFPSSCLLCASGSLNKNGHIIPELVLRWTGMKSKKNNFFFYPMDQELFKTLENQIIQNNGLGLPVSDLLKYPMLCDDCEQKFSKYEKHFTDKYFKRYYRGNEVGELDDAVYFLVISIAWRVIVSTKIMIGQEALEGVCHYIENMMKDILECESFPVNEKKYGPEVAYFTVEDIKEFVGEKSVSTSAIDFSIQQNIFAHNIFDKRLENGFKQRSVLPVVSVFLKLGRYYFVVCLHDYFEKIDCNIERERVSDSLNLFKFRMNEDLISLIRFAGGNKIYGLENYSFKIFDLDI